MVLVAIVMGVMSVSEAPEVQVDNVPAKALFSEVQTTLADDLLQVLLGELDIAIASADFRGRSRALSLVTLHVAPEEHFGASLAIKFSNRDVKERVVELYLDEYTRMEITPSDGSEETNPWHSGEAGAEYLINLMTVAESTFDPRLHSLEVQILPVSGELRECYLAVAEPGETLRLVLEAQLGARKDQAANQDYLYYEKAGKPACFSLDGAFRILALMARESPHVLEARKDETLAFVETHAKHFAAPRSVSYRPEPQRLIWQDFHCRSSVLDVLELLGDENNVRLAEELTQDPPAIPADAFVGPRSYLLREPLELKEARVADLLRSRASAQR